MKIFIYKKPFGAFMHMNFTIGLIRIEDIIQHGLKSYKVLFVNFQNMFNYTICGVFVYGFCSNLL